MSTNTEGIARSTSKASPTGAPKIFINYRRKDASGDARLLYERLVSPFGRDNVFLDVVNLKAGQKWLEEIKSHAAWSGVFLVVVGHHWLPILQKRAQTTDAADPDIVRVEIETALSKGSSIQVIPVIVGDGLEPPAADELPKSLRPLFARNVERLRPDTLDGDVDRLIVRILEIAEEQAARQAEEAARQAEENARVTDPKESGVAVAQSKVVGKPDADHYARIIELIAEEGTLVPLLGSRVNACDRTEPWEPDSGTLPNDLELAAALAKLFKAKEEGHDLAEISQFVSETRGKPDLYRRLKQLLGSTDGPNSMHRFLASLPSRLAEQPERYQMIVTTNYDNALEQAFTAADESYDLAVYMASGQAKGKFVHFHDDDEPQVIALPQFYEDLPFNDDLTLRRTLIVKINGAVDGREGSFQWKENYVITEDEYIDYLSNEAVGALIPTQLLAKLQDSHCLFLGYSMRDWHLRVFLKRIWPESIRSKSWAIEQDPDRLEKELWHHAGEVELLDAPLADYVKALETGLSAVSQSSTS